VELNEIAGSKVSTAAYIRNATQQHYYTGGFGLGAVNGINSALPGVPRMFGLEVSAKF
jgi:iron complex outermembrane receptor protein